MKVQHTQGLLEGTTAALHKSENNVNIMANKNTALIKENAGLVAKLKQYD